MAGIDGGDSPYLGEWQLRSNDGDTATLTLSHQTADVFAHHPIQEYNQEKRELETVGDYVGNEGRPYLAARLTMPNGVRLGWRSPPPEGEEKSGNGESH